MQLNSYLTFSGQCEAASKFYKQTFWPPVLVCWSIDTAYRGWLTVSKLRSEA
jgi:hypothetical protein